ncbi:alpha/beta hydrolase [Streptomyces sp. DSM 44917]|uniref:Alpha/beta hydrolase n=1 Tax=Streptomyces boetiae TaxID=3075541 RepID=A0ABU2LC85_9ACTN|nr:alpha/beta hydrolase [Streptomyces sp. DSM 44917]MDT0309086.1 alpha/beta hydrolase [Streptomyces sp. DSM 44917]
MPDPTRAADVTTVTTVSTGGARLHTEIHGPEDAPTLVLAHGWTCNTTFWHGVVRRLVPDFRVVLYDQRGHGRTPATPGNCSTDSLADDLCAVLEFTLAPGQPAIVGGHSMGAMTILAAVNRPVFRERAAAVLLCSTGADRLTGESTVLPLRPGNLRRLGQRYFLTTTLPYGGVTPVSKRVVHYITMGKGASQRQRNEMTRMVAAAPRKARGEWGRVLAGLDLSQNVAQLDKPVTIVQGTADRLTPAVHAHRIAGRLPRRPEFIELPGIGHMTPVEATDTVSDALRALAKDHL